VGLAENYGGHWTPARFMTKSAACWLPRDRDQLRPQKSYWVRY